MGIKKREKKTYTNKQFGTVGQQNKACLRRFILMKIRPGPSPGMHTVLPKYARCIDGDTGDHATRLLRFLSFETGAGLPFLLRRCASREAASRRRPGTSATLRTTRGTPVRDVICTGRLGEPASNSITIRLQAGGSNQVGSVLFGYSYNPMIPNRVRTD